MREEDNMFGLIGSTELWQWDTGRQIDCAGLQAGTKVQFAYSDTQTLSTAVKTADGASVADVPNQLLLRPGALMVYAYVTEADGVSYTKYAARFNVQARPKPDDYVYTPTEVQSWQTIRNEIGDLDDLTTTAKNTLVAAINEAAASGGGGGSVTKDSIVTALGYTPEDAANKTAALSASSTNTEYPSAKAVWDAIPHPEAKTDAMTQAVGKDADGKLWTAPGGGSGGGDSSFSLIRSLTLAEQTDRVDITTGDGGSTFALTEVYVAVGAKSYTDTYEDVNFLPNGRWGTNDPYITSSNKTSKSSDDWKRNMSFHAVCVGDEKIFAEQCQAKGTNQSSDSKIGPAGGNAITKISVASKFAAGCTIAIYGRT